MQSTLALLDDSGSGGEPVCIDELSGRRRGEKAALLVGSAEDAPVEEGVKKLVIPGRDVLPRHLSFEWDPGNCTWRVANLGLTGSVFINRNILKSGEKRSLPIRCRIQCGETRMRFECRPDAPTLSGAQSAVFEIGQGGLIIGRGEQGETGGATRVCLDSEISAISSRQAEIKREGDAYVLVNHGKFNRTRLNGGQNFTERALVFGDSIQIPGYDYYTFQFSGNSLVHIGERGVLQARALTRVASGRRILAEVNLDLACGEFLGVLGGSGQGKSTLMNAFCGIVPADQGEVRLDGIKLSGPKDMAKVGIGYVPQDDIVHRELTIRKALVYAAQLRLALPRMQIEAAVDGALKMLHLTDHQAKPIRVISGGQRKRVSIASELITNPRFLFLDEPTSGLDPETERELMGELYDLKETKGMGILCTTHVLRMSHLLSSVVFVQGGRIIFNGPPQDAGRFFLEGDEIQTATGDTEQQDTRGATAGSTNTDDYYNNKLPEAYNRIQEEVAERTENIKKGIETGAKLEGESIPECVARQMEEKFRNSKRFFTPLPPLRAERSPNLAPQAFVKRPGFFRVLRVLLVRQASILKSDPLNYLFLLAQALVIGGLVGWVSDNIVFQMFIGVIATLWFGCSNGAQQIVGELPIFQREHLAGVGMNAYLVSKFLFLTAITGLQAMLLYLTILCVNHLCHHEIQDTADHYDPGAEKMAFTQIFFNNDPEFMHPPKPAPAGTAAQAPASATADFDVVSAPDLPAVDQSGPRTLHVNPTGLNALSPGFNIMANLAWFFRVKDNILDKLGVKDVVVQPGDSPPPSGTESWVRFMVLLLAVRIGALLAAAITGVAMGLAVSAYVRTVTQAVMWVPLILIPQILFGGFVVTTPEMDPSVAVFSSILPSYNLQHLMDVANLLGCKTPRITNKTKIPAFFASPPYDKETVHYTDEDGDPTEEKYDKISDKSKSWQNLLVWRNRIGMRQKAPVGDSVERRRDVLADTGDSPDFSNEGATSWMVLGGWVVGCYIAVLIGLTKRETG